MESRFWTALAASALAAGVTTLGLFVIRACEKWAKANSAYFVSFAAGVLISASFLHIIPRSFAMSTWAPALLLAGYLGLHLFDHLLTAHVCHKQPETHVVLGLVPLLGIGFHSFVDGFIYSVTFTVSVFTGVLATTGMILHEFPEGIITYLLLLRSGFRERRALQAAFGATALSTPLGMLVSYPLIRRSSPQALGSLLALSAGMLVYVGATHLLPQAGREVRRYSLVALGAGVLAAVGIVFAAG